MRVSRPFLAITALVIGALDGCSSSAHRAGPDFPTCPVNGSITVVVGPGASVVKPGCVEIDERAHDTLEWLAREKGKTIRIEFDGQPFLGMTQAGSRFLVNCPGTDACSSGTIDPRVPPDAQPLPGDSSRRYKEYKYWQILHDTATNTEDPKDGKIIVKW